MDVRIAALHFIRLISSFAEEMESDGDKKSIEEWTKDFKCYLVDALRGRADVDPHHLVFRDPALDLLKSIAEDAEGHSRDWRPQIEEMLGWHMATKAEDMKGPSKKFVESLSVGDTVGVYDRFSGLIYIDIVGKITPTGLIKVGNAYFYPTGLLRDKVYGHRYLGPIKATDSGNHSHEM